MVRINLLPPEIIERRKYERFYPYIFISAGIVLVVILGVWGVAKYLAYSSQAELQQIQESTAQIQAQAETFKVFEVQQQELSTRKTLADQALANRVNMGGLAYDLSLILPDEVWLQALTCSEESGLTLSGYTPDTDSTGLREGFKSVAATLVRFSSLAQLNDVWLTGARKQVFTNFQNVSTETSTAVAAFDATAIITTETPKPVER